MRLCNADVGELERKDELHEDFEEEGDEGLRLKGNMDLEPRTWPVSRGERDLFGAPCHLGAARSLAPDSKSFFDLRQRTLSGMDLMPAFRVVVLGVSRKLKNNTKEGLEHALGVNDPIECLPGVDPVLGGGGCPRPLLPSPRRGHAEAFFNHFQSFSGHDRSRVSSIGSPTCTRSSATAPRRLAAPASCWAPRARCSRRTRRASGGSTRP